MFLIIVSLGIMVKMDLDLNIGMEKGKMVL